MRTSTVVSLAFLAVHLLANAPRPLQAQLSSPADVNVKNFPETQQIRGDVQVQNFPATQHIRGTVSIEGTTKYVPHTGLVVHPSRRAELTEMVFAGIVETDGFTSLLMSVQGEMRSEIFSAGTVGVLLVPDEKPILRMLRDANRVQFPIECRIPAKSGTSIYFESEQVQQRIAFARYQMYLYNTSDKSAEVNVYLYLSNAPMESGPGRGGK